jgi:hypothetical protein
MISSVPNLCMNLFSLNKALKKGFKVSNDGMVIRLTYKQVKLTFDRVIHVTDGCVTGYLMKTIMIKNINGYANASISTKRSYDINHLHEVFGHCGQEYSTIQLRCMGLSPPVILIHVNSELSQRHDRKT